MDFAFVHINKTAGSSIEKALGLRFQHRTARELIASMGLESWNDKFTFTVVRNPWDKVVSHFAYRVYTNQTGLGDRHLTFKQWVREAYGNNNPVYYDKPRMFMPQRDWVTDSNGAIVVEYIARFEKLEHDFAFICQRLGRRAVLPHLKRSPHRDYRSYYDDEAIEIVADWFRKDLEAFGYAFDSKSG